MLCLRISCVKTKTKKSQYVYSLCHDAKLKSDLKFELTVSLFGQKHLQNECVSKDFVRDKFLQ